MIDLFPFAGFPVAALGLGSEGLTTARALSLSGAEVWAWDDDAARRAATAAEAEDIELRDLHQLDWREPVSLVVEHDIPHGPKAAHPLVAAARAAGCEVICDSELLARAQRDANYVALVSRRAASAGLDLFAHVLQISGHATEVGGDAARPLLDLHPLELGGVYVLDMPPARADLTVSITFDVAVYLDLGSGAWPPCGSRRETIDASRWVFHRQSGSKGAVINIDDSVGRRIHGELAAQGDQVTIPISGHSRAPGGVYVINDVLYDDIAGRADAVTDLPGAADSDRAQLSAAVYAAAVVLEVPRHAAMASLRSAFIT